jgi:3-dehydroquinate dehydratase-1
MADLNKPVVIRGVTLGGGDGPLICTSLVGRTRDELLAELGQIVSFEPDLIEWRVDFYSGIADRNGVLGLSADLARVSRGIPLIFTVRSAREGGEAISLGDEQVASLCVEACETRAFGLIDFELTAPRDGLDRVRAAARATDTGLILSFHDFAGTPDGELLHAKFGEAKELGGDVAKVAVMPHSVDDVLTLLRASHRAYESFDMPLITMSMGPLGVLTRVAGWMFGSSVSFAVGAASSAPGQLPIEDLRAGLAVLRKALEGA